MEIMIKQNGNSLDVGIDGRLDTNAAPELMKKLEEILVAPVKELILDMENCDYIASSGLRAILLAQKKMNGLGGSMLVRNVVDDVMEVFEMTGFADILEFE